MKFQTELTSLLKDNGFQQHRCKGKHAIFIDDIGRRISVTSTPSCRHTLNQVTRQLSRLLDPDHPYEGLGMIR